LNIQDILKLRNLNQNTIKKIIQIVLFLIISLNCYSQIGMRAGSSFGVINDIQDYNPYGVFVQIQVPIQNAYISVQNIFKNNIKNTYDVWELGIMGGLGYNLQTNFKINSILYTDASIGYNFNNLTGDNKRTMQYSFEVGYSFEIKNNTFLGLGVKYDEVILNTKNIKGLHLVVSILQPSDGKKRRR